MLRETVQALNQQAEKPNLYAYVPHDKQKIFHEDPRFGRLFIGGNQSGKTTASVVEAIWWCIKKHPYRKFHTMGPIHGRIVVVDFLEGMEKIVLPELQRWVPLIELKNESWLDSWDSYRRTLTFANGSTIEFLSYEQDLEKHAGTKRNFIYFDEEPPESIYGENMARLLAQRDAAWWCAMTPTKSFTWTDDRFVNPPENIRAQVESSVLVIKVDTEDNEANLPEGTVERTLGLLSEDERKMRAHGTFTPRGGRVYPEFQISKHGMIERDWMPPHDWTVWMAMDSGWTNPTAVLYTAVSPDGRKIVTFQEFVEKGRTVKEWANIMKNYEASSGITVYNRVGDPAMNQHREITGTSVIIEYSKLGIYIATDGIPRGEAGVKIGVEKVKQYLAGDPPYWQISGKRCPVLCDQMKKLQWDYIQSERLRSQTNAPERIKKLHDHAPDAIRYMFTQFPDLVKPVDEVYDPLVENDYLATLVRMAEKPDNVYAPVGYKRPRQDDWEEEYFSGEDFEGSW
jgi:phage terminase large subunit-like protein